MADIQEEFEKITNTQDTTASFDPEDIRQQISALETASPTPDTWEPSPSEIPSDMPHRFHRQTHTWCCVPPPVQDPARPIRPNR